MFNFKITRDKIMYFLILAFVLFLAILGKNAEKSYLKQAGASINNMIEDHTEINGTVILKDSVPTIDSSNGMK